MSAARKKRDAAMLAKVRAEFEEIRRRWPAASPAARDMVAAMLWNSRERNLDRLVDSIERVAHARAKGSADARAARTAEAHARDERLRPQVERLRRERGMSDRAIAKWLKENTGEAVSRQRVAKILARSGSRT